MARPKKVIEKKAPVKRTRRAVAPEPRVAPAPVPEGWVDEQLRKECLQIAANNGSSITTLVKDAEGLYYFIKGYESISLAGLREKLSAPLPQRDPVPEPYPTLSTSHDNKPETVMFPKSKFDAHTL